MFQNRIKNFGKINTGVNYYYRNLEYNMERTKKFYLELKEYNITEEIFEKYKYQFFILINTTFKISNHPEAEEF